MTGSDWFIVGLLAAVFLGSPLVILALGDVDEEDRTFKGYLKHIGYFTIACFFGSNRFPKERRRKRK